MSTLENSSSVTMVPADEFKETTFVSHLPCPPDSVRLIRRRLHRRRWQWSALFVFLLPGVTMPAPALAAPYLHVTGVIGLRFQKPIVPYSAPPKPIAEASATDLTQHGPDIIPPEKSVASLATPAVPADSLLRNPASTSPPRQILPDEMMPRLVPEDVLPYFQFPTVKQEKTLSTATYKQQ